MKVLVLNSGSSSVKYQLIETSLELMAANADKVLARGGIDRIGEAVRDHDAAIQMALGQLTEPGRGAIQKLDEIEAVGHRMVHGGDYFSEPVQIDDAVAARIRECSALAPLHNPHNLSGYEAARRLLPDAAHVAVFDTAFHQTLAPPAYTYGLPYEMCARHRLRRYGFHGVSHRYVSLRFAEIHGRPPGDFKLITCHLGNGCSMCAIDRGRSVETSMGFTPLEGLVMGTRGGDIDPGAAIHLMKWEGLDAAALDSLLNHSSGLLGISGISNDMRALLARAGEPRAQLAIDVFAHRVRKYIGAYFAVLNGADAIIFTAGIGEHSPAVRAAACRSLEALGIRIDAARNEQAVGVEMDISAADAATRVWVIPTNEELLIGRDTVRCIHAS
jgi:acetate kinase